MIKSSLNVLTGAFSFMPKDFNSHARVGRDLDRRRAQRKNHNFNSHARVGRDMAMVIYAMWQFTFQLTRPCRA